MAEWLKKNLIIAIINLFILIMTSIIGFSVNRVVSTLDSKADKIEVNRQFEVAKSEREKNQVRIEATQKSSDEKLDIILKQFEELRKDLRLKQDKP